MNIYWEDNANPSVSEALYAVLENVILLGLERANKSTDCEISISFVEAAEIRALNREYRGKDNETDVLSFPVPQEFIASSAFSPVPLGDIVICTPVAQTQADAYGHSFEREMAFLITHGLLHLMGYDHEDDDEGAVMFAEQEAILGELGINRQFLK